MIHVEIDKRQLRKLEAALADEGTGRAFRRDLTDSIEDALKPAVPRVRGQLFALPTSGQSHAGEPLRAAVARQVKVEARLGGAASGAFVRVLRQGMPRAFRNAPKRLNQVRGWRRPVFGRGAVMQMGEPRWFDNPLDARRAAYRAAVVRAVHDMSRRIQRRV